MGEKQLCTPVKHAIASIVMMIMLMIMHTNPKPFALIDPILRTLPAFPASTLFVIISVLKSSLYKCQGNSCGHQDMCMAGAHTPVQDKYESAKRLMGSTSEDKVVLLWGGDTRGCRTWSSVIKLAEAANG
eukprot:1854795-Amphidinium_carterae.1